MIPGHPGHPPRDTGTRSADGGDVGVGLDERTLAGLAPSLPAGNALLAAYGHDLSGFLVPIALGYAWMGCVLLARRPGHPMGPLVCLIGLANAVSGFVFAYARYTVG